MAKLFPTGRQVLSAKLGLLALGTTGAMAMGLLPEPVIQVVDPDTGRAVGPGEVGEVVVTNYNRAYPLIRFGTGDMAVNVDPNPGESLQEERSIILVGRRGLVMGILPTIVFAVAAWLASFLQRDRRYE